MYEIDTKTGGNMYIYRGIKYNPQDLKEKPAKKAAKTERVYRGTKHAA